MDQRREMSDDDGPGAAAIVNAFLQTYLSDRDEGRETSLSDYQEAFPGYEGLIAREYEALRSGRSPDPAAPASVSTFLASGPISMIDSTLPDWIGPYRVLEPLGEGGMGTVVLAEQREPIYRRVAIKVIKLGMDSKQVLRRFEGERVALALMNHPNIARVYEAGTVEGGRPYFVMEYVAGRPITAYCDEYALGVRRRVELFLQVCDGVQHAHQKGVIHRDLKGSNILVATEDDRPVPKIIDFGIAKSMNRPFTEHTVYTEIGQMVGTLEYMSPEQAEFKPDDIDTRTDIYALGVLLYELLVGSVPIEDLRSSSYDEARRRVREEEPPRPSERLSRIPGRLPELARTRGTSERALIREVFGDLDWIVMKALEKDRTRRYASASELAADLRRYLADEPVVARRTTVTYQLFKFARRRRRELVATAVVLLLIAVTWGASVLSARAARTRESRDLQARAQAIVEEREVRVSELERIRAEYLAEKERNRPWQPPWERQREIELRERVKEIENDIATRQITTLGLLQRAQDLALPGSEPFRAARRALEEIHFEYYRRALEWGDVPLPPAYFRELAESLELGTYTTEFEARVRVWVGAAPAVADVYCFRFENHEERLIPVPFDPRAGAEDPRLGLLRGPFLRVAKRWPDNEIEVADDDPRRGKLYPFREGDRIVTAGGQPVPTRGDLARVLASAVKDGSVRVEVERPASSGSCERVELEWVPFPRELYTGKLPPPFSPGRLLVPRLQLAITFEGYPLEFHPGAKLGTTSSGPLEVDLPAGSYLLVLRAKGFRDTRYPVASATPFSSEEMVTVRLLRDDEIPPDCEYIAGGPFFAGGDREVDQSLPPGVRDLPGFFIKRHEATRGDYLRFLNDPRNEIGEKGLMAPRAPLPGDLLRLGRPPEIDVRPHWDDAPLVERTPSGEWGLSTGHPDFPVHGVSVFAALEYARWLTENDGGRWTYRLPGDLEWEKAARGVDRRPCVWGMETVWSFCRSLYGWPRAEGFPSTPAPVGASPMDESVYGVRDLAGSVEEPTSDLTSEPFSSFRGTSFFMSTEYYLRIANRNGRLARSLIKDAGIRLVADLSVDPE